MAELSQSKLLKSNLVGFSIHKMYSANAMKRGSFFMRKFFPLWQKPLLLFLLVFFLGLLCKLLRQNLHEQEKYPLIEDFFPFWQKPLLLFLLVFFLGLLCKLLRQNLHEQEKYPLIEDFFSFSKNHFYFSYWCFPAFALQAAASKPL